MQIRWSLHSVNINDIFGIHRIFKNIFRIFIMFNKNLETNIFKNHFSYIFFCNLYKKRMKIQFPTVNTRKDKKSMIFLYWSNYEMLLVSKKFNFYIRIIHLSEVDISFLWRIAIDFWMLNCLVFNLYFLNNCYTKQMYNNTYYTLS